MAATNQMRREAAKRKLENQQRRRAERLRRRKRVATITAAVVTVVVVVGAVLLSTVGIPSGTPTPQQADPAAAPTTQAAAKGACTFAPTPDEPAAKPAPIPSVTTAETSGTVPVRLETNQGAIPLTLDRASGPCHVESFLSLTGAGFFNDTPCHRLTTDESLKVLQCGDPSGQGTGGPGYTVNDEPPTDLAPASAGSVTYPRGTVAMANTGSPNSGGSQFFLVYGDSTLPPDYTVFGTVDEDGLATLDKVAEGGTDSGEPDGAPKLPVTIQNAAAG